MPTEAEMMQKWCPHVRAIDTATMVDGTPIAAPANRYIGHDFGNPGYLLPVELKCIGSRCSQWDWYQGDLTKEGDPERQGDCGLKR